MAAVTAIAVTRLLALLFAVALAPVSAEHVAPGLHRDPAGAGQRPVGARKLRAGPAIADLRADLDQAVTEALGVGHDIHHGRLLATRAKLQPMWRALAKNPQGRIDRRSLRYMVHRYFLKMHGLSLVGLEPLHSNTSHTEAALLTARAPAYVRGIIEGRASGAGFSIEDAAALVAVLERLMEDSGHEMLEASYTSRGYDVRDSLSLHDLLDVLEGYLLRWMLGDDEEGVEQLEANHSLIEESFEDWTELAGFFLGQVMAFQHQRWSRPAAAAAPRTANAGKEAWGPLRPHFSFADAQAMVATATMSFGSFWETECARVKESLVRMDSGATGRVRLADFHAAALAGEWRFSESREYLRELGALDESSSLLGPRVLIPNYMQAASNCIISQQHFRVCCLNECEDHLSELEAAIGAPLATPEEVLSVLSNFSWGLEDEAPRLQASLRSQLHEIAQANSGRIPLHGRLFAQWLHYLFPRECPFPHRSGTTTAMTPMEYGEDYIASEAEMSEHAEGNNQSGTAVAVPGEAEAGSPPLAADAGGPGLAAELPEDEWMTQWSHEEELLSEHVRLQAPWESRVTNSFAGACAAATMAAAAVCLFGGAGRRDGRLSLRQEKDFLPLAATGPGRFGPKAHFV